jgi:UDP-glucose 4-epimerase
VKILVTGGAGFIGSNLCRRLAQEPRVSDVVVLDDLSTGFRSNLEGVGVSLHETSLLDESGLARAARGCEAIIHLAALGSVPRSVADPVATHEANARGTLNVLQAARAAGGLQVVLASSSSVYGANPALPKVEDMACMPMSPYAVSKLAAEQYAMAFARCYGLPVLPFRFFNVYGPRQRAGHAYAAVVPVFVDAALRGLPLPVHGDGTQSRDFTFVDTVTAVLSQAVLDKVTSEPTNLAFGTRTELNAVIQVLEQILGHPLEIDRRPSRPGDVPHSQAGNDRLRRHFPDVRPFPLTEGIQRTVEWMRSLPRARTESAA